jgi:3-isopropylmalate dehydrogenase
MASYRIGVIPGDGIGPEVTDEALKVLEAVAEIEEIETELVEYPYSGAHYLETGELVPNGTIEEWKELDAVLLGAIGHPEVEPGLVERAVILGLRFGLDLYVNLRPVKVYAEHLCPLKGKGPDDVDMVVIRENTEGLYAQMGGRLHRGEAHEVATVEGVYTRHGCERVVRHAFEVARERAERRGEGEGARLTLVDKANAIRPQEIWQDVLADVAPEYPEVETDHAYVDAACMWMVKNPEWFDVVVTTNLFGDVLTDLGAMLQGGMGIAASGNIHPGRTSMFEPIHGSAPRHAGRGVASPLGAILSAAMMLDYLGEATAGRRIEGAVAELLRSRTIPATGTDSGMATAEMGDLVVGAVREGLGTG